MQFIDLKTQYQRIEAEVQRHIQAVLEHGQYIMGPEVAELEAKLAQQVGVKHCIGVGSGTSALLISLMALDIKPGDEVITSPFTFIAPAEMVKLLGAKPVFVDIDPDTYNLDPNQIEAAITPRTKAILPINLYGQCADYDLILPIAEKHSLPVLVDSAQSFGALQYNKRSCAFGDIAITSFYPGKPFGCYGDGGACFTNSDALANRLRQILNNGQSSRYHHDILGITSRLDSLQAAILLAKEPIFSEEVKLRQHVADLYTQNLSSTIKRPVVKAGNLSVWAQYTIEVDERDQVQAALKEQGIPTAVHYPKSLHQQPVFADLGYRADQFPHTLKAAQRVLSLPFHPYLEESDVQKIASAIAAIHEQPMEVSS